MFLRQKDEDQCRTPEKARDSGHAEMIIPDILESKERLAVGSSHKTSLASYHNSLVGFLKKQSSDSKIGTTLFTSLTQMANKYGTSPANSRVFFFKVLLPLLEYFNAYAFRWAREKSVEYKGWHIAASCYVFPKLLEVYKTLLNAEQTALSDSPSNKKDAKIESVRLMVKYPFCRQMEGENLFLIRNFGRHACFTGVNRHRRNLWGANLFLNDIGKEVQLDGKRVLDNITSSYPFTPVSV